MRRALRAPRDLRGVQQGALLRPGERVPVVPRDPEQGSGTHARREPRGRRAGARPGPRRRAAVRARLRARAGATTDWFGLPTNTVRAVLEAYTYTGVLGLARRDGNRRYYDLLDRLLPADVLARELPAARPDALQAPVAVPAHGLLGVSGAGDVFDGIGPAKPDPRCPITRGEQRCARSSSRTASSFPSRSKA